MQKSFSFILLLISSVIFSQSNPLPEGTIVTNRTKTNLNLGWKFHLGDAIGNPESTGFNDTDWEKVAVPHTMQLVSYELDSIRETWVQEKYLRDFGWYRKTININAKPSEKIFIEFEGVHNATELWVNGKKAGSFAVNGYVPFHFDITDFVKLNADNLIVIKADNRYSQTIAPDPHKTDYVKFNGLYRDLYLVTTNKLHVGFNWEAFEAGVNITTPTVNKNNGTVSIKTTVKNENNTPRNCRIETKIINAEGYVIKKLIQNFIVPANTNHTFRQTTTIEDDFHLWSPDTPYLYRVHSVIYDDENPVDFVENTFGFRTFKLEKGKGFVLNGEPLFLIGVNRHQNYPNIGDAVPNSFHYNEALQYKNAGINIIRLSHYTQDESFLNACDALGIIVYAEVSTWIDWGDKTWFDNLETATRHMIRNQRNHPSIVFWGAGINHRGPVPRMQQVAKEEDPFRLTASASSPWNGVKNEGITDIYATMDYRRTEFPESAFTMVMEHGSSTNSEVNQFHISRYKANKNTIAAIAWLGAEYNHLQPSVVATIEGIWERDFMTTYSLLSGYRIPRPVYKWYQSELVAKPMVHIADETASNNGKIRVFSNCQVVELYHDNQLIAKQYPDNEATKAHLNHPSFTFHYTWKTGTLKAIGYTNSEKITEHSRTKQGTPHHIKLEFNINDKPFYAGGSDLRMVHAYVLDEHGEVVTSATNKITFNISGNGKFVDNCKIEANPAVLYDGVATMYIRGTEKVGKITITAASKGLKSGSATINTVAFNTNEIENHVQPIYDYPISKIDIGGEKQRVQFDWLEWTGASDKDLNYKLTDYNAEISVSADNAIQWLGNDTAMLGDLSFMGTDGVYVEKGVLKLKISGLKKGHYTVETFHHSRQGKMTNAIEVSVNDENGTFTKTADDHIVDYYINDNTGERQPLSIKSTLQSDGSTPILLEFKNLKKEGNMWLNGFILKQVK
ncbi:glycoside hydrolase family 2 TIM barrel-domain containing protein [Mariniflexile maritimum]|uniref:glycoside hydrolase family 2 TIM barrel-domain containing protein n=1 Tax=Mariniflexile maritimum TaxID=2682493 RepID=UPI0012F6ADA2|nr:glycoside hydrolase family 2 TIM barrel-domain containing protein [Mariniflexile maritimum]